LGGAVAAAVGLAELGRRRDGGAGFFHPAAALAAPLWLLERGVLSWAALAVRTRGGLPYHGRRIAVPAHSPKWLEEHLLSRAWGFAPADDSTSVNGAGSMN